MVVVGGDALDADIHAATQGATRLCFHRPAPDEVQALLQRVCALQGVEVDASVLSALAGSGDIRCDNSRSTHGQLDCMFVHEKHCHQVCAHATAAHGWWRGSQRGEHAEAQQRGAHHAARAEVAARGRCRHRERGQSLCGGCVLCGGSCSSSCAGGVGRGSRRGATKAADRGVRATGAAVAEKARREKRTSAGQPCNLGTIRCQHVNENVARTPCVCQAMRTGCAGSCGVRPH